MSLGGLIRLVELLHLQQLLELLYIDHGKCFHTGMKEWEGLLTPQTLLPTLPSNIPQNLIKL